LLGEKLFTLSLICYSWNPSGAIKAGRNPAVYLYQGKKVEVAGKALSVCDLGWIP
jgi:hypothetical protein